MNPNYNLGLRQQQQNQNNEPVYIIQVPLIKNEHIEGP